MLFESRGLETISRAVPVRAVHCGERNMGINGLRRCRFNGRLHGILRCLSFRGEANASNDERPRQTIILCPGAAVHFRRFPHGGILLDMAPARGHGHGAKWGYQEIIF